MLIACTQKHIHMHVNALGPFSFNHNVLIIKYIHSACLILSVFLFSPKFACIIVKKRINAKFFFESGRNLANPPPGTVIDGGVTNKDW